MSSTAQDVLLALIEDMNLSHSRGAKSYERGPYQDLKTFLLNKKMSLRTKIGHFLSDILIEASKKVPNFRREFEILYALPFQPKKILASLNSVISKPFLP